MFHQQTNLNSSTFPLYTHNITDFYQTLQKHYVQLLNQLSRIDDLVAWLFQSGCLQESQRQHLTCLNTPYKATEELLSFIMKQSMDTYNLFLVGLLNTQQHHIYKALTEKGKT